MKEVSTVFMLKIIWRIFSCSKSLWGEWVHHYLLQGETFWDAKETGLGSWGWRKLLRLKSLAKNFIKMDIRDGCTVRFWTDVWHPRGRLIELTGEIGMQKLGVRRSARICDVFVGEEWRLRNWRDHRIQEITQDIMGFPLALDGTVADSTSWKCGTMIISTDLGLLKHGA